MTEPKLEPRFLTSYNPVGRNHDRETAQGSARTEHLLGKLHQTLSPPWMGRAWEITFWLPLTGNNSNNKSYYLLSTN